MRTFTVGFVVGALLAACGRGAPQPAAGTERGACYGNGTCNAGLECLSGLCVRPAGADCDRVADKLAGLMLGNYAPREQRDAYLAATRQACVDGALSADDATCLLAAPHRNALARCPRVIGAGDCAAIVAHLEGLRPTAPDPFLVTAADRLAARCKSEVPSRALHDCVLAATSVAALDRCAW